MDFFDEQRMCHLYEKFLLEYYKKEHLRQEIGQTQRFCLDAQFFREQVCSLHIADAEQ